jgi:hypothetical protein
MCFNTGTDMNLSIGYTGICSLHTKPTLEMSGIYTFRGREKYPARGMSNINNGKEKRKF